MHNDAGVLTLTPDGTRDFQVSGSFGHGIFLEGSDGKVGIGTASPEQDLTVNGNIQVPNQRDITWSDIGDGQYRKGCYNRK